MIASLKGGVISKVIRGLQQTSISIQPDMLMDAERDKVIQSLRPGDLIGHSQQSAQYVYEVIKVEHQHLLVARPPMRSLRFVVLQDAVPPF